MGHWANLLRSLAKARGYYVGVLPPITDTPQTHLARVLEALRVTCVVDVGAHYGQFGALVRSAGFGGRLLSFEPVRASFGALAERAATDPEWQCLPYALGAKDGSRRMHVTGASSCASFFEPSAYARRQLRPESIEVRDVLDVEVRRLDAVLPALVDDLPRPRVFLKTDTQGSDLDVVRGAEGCLDVIVGVQVEVSVQAMYDGAPDFRMTLDALGALGFELSGLFPVALDRELRIIEMDCVMIRADDRHHTPPQDT